MSVRSRDLGDRLYRVAHLLTLLFLLAMALLPFLYALSVSFKPYAEVFGSPHWIPHDPTIEPWKTAFSDLATPVKNSAIIATGTAVLSLLITIPGAYVFGRKQFPGKEGLFYLVIVALLFPYILLIVPISDIWNEVGLYNTIPGLWLAYQVFVTPFAIWILRDFFEQLPANIEEAAQVYGCTQFSAFLRVILPLSMPAIVSVGFISFLVGWNDFLFANMLTTGSGPRPAVVTLFISTTGGEQTSWALLMAETLLIGIPPTVLYMISRRYLGNAFAT
ncbi:MAG: carbohydrate ABC transporter permease [Halobacteriaceae archaeon]